MDAFQDMEDEFGGTRGNTGGSVYSEPMRRSSAASSVGAASDEENERLTKCHLCSKLKAAKFIKRFHRYPFCLPECMAAVRSYRRQVPAVALEEEDDLMENEP